MKMARDRESRREREKAYLYSVDRRGLLMMMMVMKLIDNLFLIIIRVITAIN